jgi:hypothetical protein
MRIRRSVDPRADALQLLVVADPNERIRVHQRRARILAAKDAVVSLAICVTQPIPSTR